MAVKRYRLLLERSAQLSLYVRADGRRCIYYSVRTIVVSFGKQTIYYYAHAYKRVIQCNIRVGIDG